jgi:ketosteroid isomerase-like protein
MAGATQTDASTPDLLVDLARRALDAFNARDVEGLAAVIHEECEFYSAFGSVEGKVYRGRAQVPNYFGDIDSIFDDWRLESPEFHPARGGRVVSTYRAIGLARGSGFPLDFPLALLWETRDGLLSRGEVHLDQADALRRAGLPGLAEAWEPTPSPGNHVD